jgi:PAS domain S-box-containing protein
MKPPLAEEEENSAFRTRAEALIHLGHNWVWDIKTDTIYWSNEMIGIYGIDPLSFDCKGSALGKMIHPEDAWKRERAIAEVLQGKKVEPFEYRVIRSDRSERVVLVKDMQLDRSPDGRRTYLVGAIQDITERKQLEEQLSLLNLELEKRVRARTAQLEQAKGAGPTEVDVHRHHLARAAHPAQLDHRFHQHDAAGALRRPQRRAAR